jgi:hypothetical protein
VSSLFSASPLPCFPHPLWFPSPLNLRNFPPNPNSFPLLPDFPSGGVFEPFFPDPSGFSWYFLSPVHNPSHFCGLLGFDLWTFQASVLIISGIPLFVDIFEHLYHCVLIIKIRDNNITSWVISIIMDPFWNEVKGYLKCFEAILEGIQAQYNENAGRISNMESIVSLLLIRTESIIHEIQKTTALEQTMLMLIQKTEKLEQEVRHLQE